MVWRDFLSKNETISGEKEMVYTIWSAMVEYYHGARNHNYF